MVQDEPRSIGRGGHSRRVDTVERERERERAGFGAGRAWGWAAHYLDLCMGLGDDELDECGLGGAETLAREVDHVGEVRSRLRQRILEQLAVLAARLALQRLAQVTVVELAELRSGAAELRLGARAEARDQLLVVAANKVGHA